MDGEQNEGKAKATTGTKKTAQDADADVKAETNRMKDDIKIVDFKEPKATPVNEMKTNTTVKKTTEVSATSSCSSALSLSLHDCLSLGEIELGLERRQCVRTSHKVDTDDYRSDNSSRRQEDYLRSVEEIRRLPYLLRMLSSTRPLASIESFVTSKSKSEEDKDLNKSIDMVDSDDHLNRINERLEDVAATYSVAGGIDVVTNHLAPTVAKNLSRLPPLLKTHVDCKKDGRKQQSYGCHLWRTEDLAAVSRDPIAKRKRRKKDSFLSIKKIKYKKNNMDIEDHNAATGIEDILGSTSDEDEKDEDMDIELDDMSEGRRPSFKRRDSMIVAAEDTQESTVIKTLSELASLVVTSLEYCSNHDVEGEDDQQHPGAASGGRKASSLLSLNTDDILSEKAASMSTSGRLGAGDVGWGAMEGNDLSSTIVAIMHNAPVLQSRHVANALCRASVPQTGDIISRLGANCPASVPSLLLGCIEAYSMSIEYRHRDDNDGICSSNGSNSKANLSCPVVTAAKSAIAAIARLSQKESCRVQNKLQSLGIMIDMQLKLAMEEGTMVSAETKTETGIVHIACLLIEHLSFSTTKNIETEGSDSTTSNMRTNITALLEERMKSEGVQTSGDTSNDYKLDKLVFDYATACSKDAEPSLLLHFVLNPDLYVQILDFFSQTMKLGASISPSLSVGGKKSIGKRILIMRAYALLLLVPVPRSTISSDSASGISNESIEPFMALLKNLDYECGECKSKSGGDLPKKSEMDTLVGLVSSCAVLLLSRNLAIEDVQGNDETGKMAQTVQIMRTIFKILRSTSEQSNMVRISFEDQLRKSDTWGVFKRVLYPLEMVSNIQEGYANNSYHSKQSELNRLCKGMRLVVEDTNSENKLDMPFNIHFRLHVLRRELESPNELLVKETKEFLGCILEEESEDETLSLVKNVESAQFVVEATKFLVKPGSSEIPLVLPAHIEIAWSKIASDWNISGTKPTDGYRCNFLFRLIYAFIFLDKSPLSPFAFDPRSSPIKESLLMIQNIPSKSTRNYLFSEIQDLIWHHCPELTRYRFDQRLSLGLRKSPPFDTLDRKSILSALSSSIRAHLQEKDTQICENKTEQLFLLAKARICDSDVYSTVTNALLSSCHAPSPTYSYRLLCRDPIVCLKFPLSVWKRRSLRRIALSLLGNLLTANNAIALEESRLKVTALELLVARDSIVVRCLLAALHGGDSNNFFVCSMTTSFIRWMIQSRSGLIALIVKQGLQERDLDWLVENVPETMNDSRYLLQIFSERNCLTAADRLVAADAANRIAIVHGQANETEAAQLILTAVSQLVDSFYLILGPVGLLPVDALFNAESGTPITQTSQKAAFRILKALTKLRGIRNHFRRDFIMVLQKFISLCKGELQGVVAGRRKLLIKELHDAAVKIEQ